MPDGSDKPSMEETMGQVFDKIKSDEATTRANEAAEVADPPEQKPEAAPETPPENETAEQKAERLRAEDGKFRAPTRKEKTEAKKAAEAPTKPAEKPAEAAKAAPGTQDATKPVVAPVEPPNPAGAALAGVQPPPGWSPAAKAAFGSLPPAVQAAVARREQEVSDGFKQYSGLNQALAPMAQTLQMRGVQPAQYVNQMVQLDRALTDPQTRGQAFDYLFRTYGYQPGAGQQQNVATGHQPQLSEDPTVAALQRQLALVTQHLTSQEAARAQELQALQADTQRQAFGEVEKFRNDPANEFFDLVRDDVRAVYERAAMANQPAPALATAYEQAIWANPQTRPVLIAREQQRISDGQAKAASEAAAKARKSQAPNVRGSVGASPSSAVKRPIEEEMAEVYDKLHA